jgi:hypothetical protein
MEIAEPLRTECVNTIKFLAVDGVEKANSGHPGMPMGCADLALEIWTRHLCYVPDDPHWVDRDRFVLSAGHGSMLLYGLLHLAGPRATRSSTSRRASRPRRARSARASRTASGWRSRASTSPRASRGTAGSACSASAPTAT